MGDIWLPDLVNVVADAGLNYRTWQGWETRARSSGGYDEVWAVFCHHTASNTAPDNDAAYMWNNATDRPIGAILLERTGRVTIGAAGATNCQGKGGAYPTSHGTIPLDKGNVFGIAIEAANAGTGEVWPDVQTDAYVMLCGALCDAYGLDPTRDVVSHFEWTDRKIDPAGPSPWATGSASWAMDRFRADVTDCTTLPEPGPEPPEPEPPEPEGVDMPALIIQANGGQTSGAVAVTDLAMTSKRFIQGADVGNLLGSGFYGKGLVVVAGLTFDAIPSDATVDVIEGGR